MAFPQAKYKIGDLLYIVQEIEEYKSLGGKYTSLPRRIQVVGILYDECYAGVQINYKFRLYTKDAQILVNYLEFELTDTFDKESVNEVTTANINNNVNI